MNTERMRSDCLRPPFSLIALTLLAEPITYTFTGRRTDHGALAAWRSAGRPSGFRPRSSRSFVSDTFDIEPFMFEEVSRAGARQHQATLADAFLGAIILLLNGAVESVGPRGLRNARMWHGLAGRRDVIRIQRLTRGGAGTTLPSPAECAWAANPKLAATRNAGSNAALAMTRSCEVFLAKLQPPTLKSQSEFRPAKQTRRAATPRIGAATRCAIARPGTRDDSVTSAGLEAFSTKARQRHASDTYFGRNEALANFFVFFSHNSLKSPDSKNKR